MKKDEQDRPGQGGVSLLAANRAGGLQISRSSPSRTTAASPCRSASTRAISIAQRVAKLEANTSTPICGALRIAREQIEKRRREVTPYERHVVLIFTDGQETVDPRGIEWRARRTSPRCARRRWKSWASAFTAKAIT